MDPDTEVILDCSPLFRRYKSGRVERLMGTTTVPPSTDPLTSVTTKDITIPTTGLSARLYLPPSPPPKSLPILIYIHGGAFCTGSASNPNPFLTSLVARTPLLAISLDYRLAPEHPLPAAYDDCWSALQWLLVDAGDNSRLGEPEPWLAEYGDLTRTFLMGESAGANIAHNMAMKAGKEGGIKFEGMVLGHPYFWGREAVGEETRDEEVRGKVEGLWRIVGLGLEDERVDPMVAKEVEVVEGFVGRVMVWVAEKDVLAERGKAYGEWMRRVVGVKEVEVVESEGEDHVFFYMKPECEKALELVDKMVAFVNKSE